MANQEEQSVWELGIYQFSELDELRGGVDGIDNVPLRQLANRTLYLKDQLGSKAPVIHNHDEAYSPLDHDHDGVYASPAYVDSKETPVGAIMAWPTEVEPNGWLPCEGAAVDREAYSNLFALIQSNYGDGNGETTFNLPDYRGYFLRGWDNGSGTDPDAASRADRGDGTTGDRVGTIQEDDVGPHDHSYTDPRLGDTADGVDPHSGYNGVKEYPTVNGGTTAQNSGLESRPINKSVLFVIKY